MSRRADLQIRKTTLVEFLVVLDCHRIRAVLGSTERMTIKD
jgi:hypothetical protein